MMMIVMMVIIVMVMILLFQAKETALHVCARYDQPEVLAFLCQAGVELNLPDNVSSHILIMEPYYTGPCALSLLTI